MISLLKTIIGAFTGDVAKALADAYRARETAKTDAERLAAEERIDRLRQVAAVQTGSRIDAIVRALIAGPIILFLWKVIAWDKVAGWGRTDDLSENLWLVVMIVIGFYFVHNAVRDWRRR